MLVKSEFWEQIPKQPILKKFAPLENKSLEILKNVLFSQIVRSSSFGTKSLPVIFYLLATFEFVLFTFWIKPSDLSKGKHFILLSKLFWPTVRKKLRGFEKIFEIWGWRLIIFKIFEITWTIYSNTH